MKIAHMPKLPAAEKFDENRQPLYTHSQMLSYARLCVAQEVDRTLDPLSYTELHDCFQQRTRDKVTERRLIFDAIISAIRSRMGQP